MLSSVYCDAREPKIRKHAAWNFRLVDSATLEHFEFDLKAVILIHWGFDNPLFFPSQGLIRWVLDQTTGSPIQMSMLLRSCDIILHYLPSSIVIVESQSESLPPALCGHIELTD